MKTIPPQDLRNMQDYAKTHALRIDLAYARADNLLFGERIYRPDARLWLHESLAAIVLKAAESLQSHGLRIVLYDGLRTTDAQEKMLQTKRVRDNPQWLREPRLLSPPGAGGHPRGMAVDIALETLDGQLLDMGTPFDFLAADPSPAANPAHREHPHLSESVKENRARLTGAMTNAAQNLKTPLLPLPQEWWDFRLPKEVYEQYAPLSDADLPEEMRMVTE